ncbi:MAG: hypothetical protein EXR72_25790 [Myxococcales bacterium]|nr:hypothetical protein [Myxococcales bacterium]
MRRFLVAFAALWLVPAPASAVRVLRPFPTPKLTALAPLLVHGEMAAIESDAEGRPRQLSLLAYSAAPPEVVHDVVAHPERYPSFVRNVSKSEVTRAGDGTLLHSWQIELPIGHFNGENRLTFQAPTAGGAPGAPGAPGAIDSQAVGQETVARWEFLPAAGGGTVVVEYLYYEVPRTNAVLDKMIRKNPANETGMGLAAGLVLIKSVAVEAARRAAAQGKTGTPPALAGPSPGFNFLLDRGAVAIVRSLPSGALLDVSVVERIPAPLDAVLAVVRAPDRWPQFIPSVTKCEVVERGAAGLTYEISVDGILLNIDTRYQMRFEKAGVDALGVGGDLKGSRFRWDLSSRPGYTTAIYRANYRLGDSSMILRALFKYEPFFEHGANVGVGIITVRAIARRATAPAAP